MAVELPAVRPGEIPASGAVAIAGYASTSIATRLPVRAVPGEESWPRPVVRLLEAFTGALALFLISALVWGYVWFPRQIAVAILLFDVYWLWKSFTIAFHVLKGVRLMKRFQRKDWRAEYRLAAERDIYCLAWERVRHVVVIPNYKESEQKLRDTLTAMAAADGARDSVIPVLAMEDAEPGAEAKAAVLTREFAASFADFLVTYHPKDIPGEVRGKSSNEAWAARCAVNELVGRRGLDIDHLTVTSCDADTIFPPQYFECLSFHFATDPMRYRRFWQAPIFFYNNIWQVPAPLRITNSLSGLIHLSRLSGRRHALFSQSTYSLSMRMAHDVGYWDTNVIPEDWHMFLKCFYRLGGHVEVQPLHLPLGNDGALSHSVRATFINQYLQVQRWAWGASDVPYAVEHTFRCTDIPFRRRLFRLWTFFENHITWSTQWFFITLGGFIPWVYGVITGHILIPEWFYIDQLIDGPTYLPGWVTLPTVILTPCLLFYITLITVESRLRPPAPPHLSGRDRLIGHVHWLLISPITFFFSALPALDSQVRLLLGRRMEYRVTEKV